VKKLLVFLMIVVSMLLFAVPAMATPGTGLDIQRAIDRGLPLGFRVLKLVDCEPYLGIPNALSVVNQWEEFWIYFEPENVRLRKDADGKLCHLNIIIIALDGNGNLLYAGMPMDGPYRPRDDNLWIGLGSYVFNEDVEGRVLLIVRMYDGFRDRSITEELEIIVCKKSSFA